MRRAIPNLISASRLVLVIPLGLMLLASVSNPAWRRAAICLFIWIAFSDWLDGYLARRFAAQTALGRLLDPLADKLLALVCFVVLVVVSVRSDYPPIPLWLVALVVGKDIWIVTGYAIIRMMGIDIAVRPSVWGKASTFFQLALIGSILVGPELNRLHLGWGEHVLMGLVAIMTVVATVNYTVTGVRRLLTVQLADRS